MPRSWRSWSFASTASCLQRLRFPGRSLTFRLLPTVLLWTTPSLAELLLRLLRRLQSRTATRSRPPVPSTSAS